MKSGVPLQVQDVREQTLETAQAAARRSGMSVAAWLDSVVADSAVKSGIEPARPRADYHASPDQVLGEVKSRLDTLAQQLDRLASVDDGDAPRTPYAPEAPRDDETSRPIAEAMAQLSGRLDQMMSQARTANGESQRRVGAVDRAVAGLDREPPAPATPPVDPPTPLDEALREIGERQRALDGEATSGAAPRIEVRHAEAPRAEAPRAEALRAELPRAPTQGFSDLEQQLRQITSRIEGLRPCGIEAAVETLRDDLAEIGLMLKEAMPRRAIEALETEVRALAQRIEDKRDAGVDGTSLAGIERGLAEVRDALRALTPAEHLVGFDETVKGLSQKIDLIATNTQDPVVLEQLQQAIAGLRGMVTHIASNDALAKLSEEVRTLAHKIDQVASSAGSGADILSNLERRIATMADALQARHQTGEHTHDFETVLKGLTDRIEQLPLARTEPPAAGPLDDRMVRLIERLEASDARLGQFESIERGLVQLLTHFDRLQQSSGDGASVPEVDGLKRDVQRTQESLEAVHGTLGHLVDRLAMIETGMRRDSLAEVATIPAPSIIPAQSMPLLRPSAPAAPMPDVVASLPPQSAAPAQPKPVPAPAQERRPIDPNLPPDHPLEPGSAVNRGNGASAAERIAASEAALGPAKPPVIPDPAGKSNFIAAARRAAQAAAGEAALRADKRTMPAAAAKTPAAARSGGRWTRNVRSVLVAASVVMIVLGSLHLVMSLINSADEPAEPASTQSIPSAVPAEPAVSAPVPIPEKESLPAPPSAPPAGRQSVLIPRGDGTSFPAPAVGWLPVDPARQAAGATPDTDSATTNSLSKPAAAVTPVPEAAAGARPGAAEKLPAAIGSAGLRTAAARGDAAAAYEIALRFAEGKSVPQNLTQAAEWFERAGQQGLAPAQFRLGGLYEKGLGVKKNLETARRLYTAAAEAGNAKAMHNLAVIHAEGVDGKPDYQSAAKWFRKAADYGVVDSQYNLGILYARGIGVEVNLAEAYKWFTLAARDGDRDAARKRDDVGGRLDQPSLTAAKLAIQNWAAEPQPEAATHVKAPAGGWDEAAAAAPAKRRTAGPKADLSTPGVSTPGATQPRTAQ